MMAARRHRLRLNKKTAIITFETCRPTCCAPHEAGARTNRVRSLFRRAGRPVGQDCDISSVGAESYSLPSERVLDQDEEEEGLSEDVALSKFFDKGTRAKLAEEDADDLSVG
eukprot:CAMPEP_0197440668 /NCGR_PEP_ID=MMETSP1175-20131217/7112_1 /TAXON_ID=1003142 /ORGANISM="Triceratium dubium, Strain CCMP147" /LENGTH=111 /DNA_ID=CAMNT_0042970815 /DNA_START=186 /DNA_END=522 /DNA_ORIENTATION=-